MASSKMAYEIDCVQKSPGSKPLRSTPVPPLELTIAEYKKIKLSANRILRRLLRELNFNSVKNFFTFYTEYKRGTACLLNFFKNYIPKIENNSSTCIGMAMELIKRWSELDSQFPNFAKSAKLVYCEEGIDNVLEYISLEGSDPAKKLYEEHVLVCVNVKIEGRIGLLLADPGYHTAEIATVMLDEEYPHSHWLNQTKIGKCLKKFYYKYNSYNHNFIEWNVAKDVRRGVDYKSIGLINIRKLSIHGINASLRRHLVYQIRSIMARNSKGQITGGVYFPVKINSQFTLILVDGRHTEKKEYDFAFLNDNKILPEKMKNELIQVNRKLRLADGKLETMLRKVAKILMDQDFVQQMLLINKHLHNHLSKNRPFSMPKKTSIKVSNKDVHE